MNTSSDKEFRPSILIVDDEPDISLALTDFLTFQGFHVEVLHRGNEAIDAVRASGLYSTVLLDMGLPDVDGLTVLKAIVRLDPQLPVVILTAFAETEKTVDTLKHGAFAYLKKPYNREELVATLHRAIAVKKLATKAERVEQELSTSESRLRRERKLAEQAIQESEGRLQAIMDGSSAVIYVKDLEGRYILINRKFESVFNLNRTEIIGKTDFEIFPQEIAEAFRSNDAMVVVAKAPLQSEEVAPHADGLHTYVSNKFPLWDTGGCVYAVCGISTDITKRKRAEEALQESEGRFRQLVEIIKEVFWLTDLEKTEILYISPGYEAIWGRSCASLYAAPQNWLEAIHTGDRNRVVEAALHKQVNGDYDEEYRIVRPDGSIRWIRDRAFPVKNEAGTVYRLAGIAEDITEQKERMAK